MSKRFSILFGLGLMLISLIIYVWLTSSPPEARTKPPLDERISVLTEIVQPRNITPQIVSYGRIQARTQSQLNAEISGQVSWISPKLRNGSQFKKGDVLIRINSSDYQSQIDMSKANVVEARLKYEQEEALSKQARINWERLALDREPTDLVLRKPQLAAAKAAWESASAELSMARNDFSRTAIRAPYDGWVLNKHIDVGQVVNTGTPLADIYSDGALEIRLPVALDDLKLIDLPEDLSSAKDFPKAIVINELGGEQQPWQATVIRSDAAIDDKTQQLYVIARIDQPLNPDPTQVQRRFKINQYADALIDGNTFKDVIAIPNEAISQAQRIFVIDANDRIQRRQIEVAWNNDKLSVVKSGLQAGEEIVVTPLGDFAQGKTIKRIIDSSAADAERPQEEPVAEPVEPSAQTPPGGSSATKQRGAVSGSSS